MRSEGAHFVGRTVSGTGLSAPLQPHTNTTSAHTLRIVPLYRSASAMLADNDPPAAICLTGSTTGDGDLALQKC
jgi:hypothetical protein